MRKFVAVVGLLIAWPIAQAGRVEVRFVGPERYVDANLGVEAERTRHQLAEYLTELGEKRLPLGQSMIVEILDIDLAGEIRHGSRVQPEPRVLLGKADWPSITLRYVLSEDGRTLRQGEDRVTDMNYMTRERLPAGKEAEPLAYEKRMLDEWFRQRFAR